MTLMSVIVAFLFAISLWYLSSNHKVTFVKLKATDLKFLPDRSWHRLIPAGGTFVSAKGGTFQSDTPGTFVSAMRGTIDSAVPGTFESDTGGTFNPLLSDEGIIYYYYFKDGGVIIITEGSLLEFDFETLEPLACSSKTAIGMIGEKYWRRDNVGGKVRAYYVNVPENSKKSYDASLNSIILSRQESWSKGPRRTSPARRHF